MAKKLTVALIYDFDGTLSPGNMQEYDFIPAIGKSNREFWEESNETAREQDGDPILAYMYRMLHEAKSSGISLRRESFARSGQNIELYEGVREWFPRINAYAAQRFAFMPVPELTIDIRLRPSQVRPARDDRRDPDRQGIPEDLRLFVPLRYRRRGLLAGRGGQLHQ